MADAPAVLPSARERWLAERRELLTASDVAAVLGVDPRRSPLSVYAEKRGLLEVAETPWMRWGRRVEGAIAEAYADETGRPVRDLGLEIQRHPDVPWLGATLDRQVLEGSAAHPLVAPGPGPLEAK